MLHARASAAALATVRIAVFGSWLVYVLADPTTELALLPPTSYAPIGILRAIPDPAWPLLFSTSALEGLKASLVALLLAVVAGLRPFPPLAILTCALLTLHQGLVCSLGSVNHGELALLMTAWVLAPFPAADALTVRGRRATAAPDGSALYRAPLLTAATVLGLTYTFVGTHRLTAGGLQVFLDGSIVRMVVMRALELGDAGGGPGHLVLTHGSLVALLQVAFPVLTGLEILSLGCLGWPRFRRFWIAGMIPFHLAAEILLQVPLRSNLLLILVLLTDLPTRAGRRLAELAPPRVPP
jgi:hypothetical protein